jgi:Peptidase M15
MVKFFKALIFACVLGCSIATAAHAYSGSAGGLNPRLRSLLSRVEGHFNRPVTVVSGCRSRAHNRRIGGARESWHLRCQAADIEVRGVNKYAVARYASNLPGRGGIGTYCHDGSVHIDLGPKRQWYWCDRVRNFSQGSIHRTTTLHKRRHAHHTRHAHHRWRKHHRKRHH